MPTEVKTASEEYPFIRGKTEEDEIENKKKKKSKNFFLMIYILGASMQMWLLQI